MKTLPEQATGKAHGKIILLGEHAVVYGEPAIAFPFKAAPVEVTITKSEIPTRIQSDYFQGFLHEAPQSLNNFKILVKTLCSDLHRSSDGLSITITSDIPAERGMGSSAAVATALVRALFAYFNVPLDREKLLSYVDMSEKIAHGNPSGLDARVTSSEDPVFYKKGHAVVPFDMNSTGYLIAADTGVKGQTRQAVEAVAEQVEGLPDQTLAAIRQLGSLTLQAKKAIESNHMITLGSTMTEAHDILKHLQVSSEKLDVLVDTALKHGALGAKLTGGGRGGCMIALASTKEDAENIAIKLMEQGAAASWIHALGADDDE